MIIIKKFIKIYTSTNMIVENMLKLGYKMKRLE